MMFLMFMAFASCASKTYMTKGEFATSGIKVGVSKKMIVEKLGEPTDVSDRSQAWSGNKPALAWCYVPFLCKYMPMRYSVLNVALDENDKVTFVKLT